MTHLKQFKRLSAAALLTVISLSRPAIAQDMVAQNPDSIGGNPIVAILQGVAWVIVSGTGAVVGYISSGDGWTQDRMAASYDDMTEEECRSLNGYISWHPDSRSERLRRQRGARSWDKGVCYTDESEPWERN
jgi:uncharacterized protein (DUF433 family)